MPPIINLELDKSYYVKFKEKGPRIVKAGHGRLTPVINVEIRGEPKTFFLSHVDLARKIRDVERSVDSLENVKMRITKRKPKGKKSYVYEVIYPVVEVELVKSS
jgi:hypothetical protein